MSSLRRRLTGLFAFAVLLGIVIGLPVVLLALGASPVPHALPTLEAIRTAFTSPDDGTLALTAIKVIAWCSWLFLTVSILLEMISRIRGIRAPRLPGLAMPQSAARGLVGAAVLLFIVSPIGAQVATAAPAAAAPAAPAAVSTAVAGAPATPVAATQHAAAVAPKKETPPATVTHTVKHGETLWSIAQEHLGSGTRYKEIVKLNPALPPGGSFIKAGDELRLPAPTPATPDSTYTVKKGDTLSAIAEHELGDADRYPRIVKASLDITQPGGAHLSDPDVIDVGWTLAIPTA
ncbi:MAG: LysM peptidoglycan-binding domain-containing protein, partial [Tomitella sp.]|nr:LysM peptidoglycan-binding domain-containing protein [Tomitella sp.]